MRATSVRDADYTKTTQLSMDGLQDSYVITA
jgi:hypothetical protein